MVVEVTVISATVTEPAVDSACTSPYITAPSSPKHQDDVVYSTVPSTPHRVDSPELTESPEHKLAKKPNPNGLEDDFAFHFSVHFDGSFLSAEELFDRGKIRPLKPPPRLQLDSEPGESSPKSNSLLSREPFTRGEKMFRNAFSSRESVDFDPFDAAMERTRKDVEQKQNHKGNKTSSSFMSLSSCSSNSFKGYRKWRLKNLLSFRAPAGSAKDDEAKGGGSGSSSRSSVCERQFGVDRGWKKDSDVAPYRHGFLGCMRFSHSLQGLVKGMESVSRG